jgi:hypothetical protein
MALEKPKANAPRLVRLTCFFYWKAQKSPNKHPLKQTFFLQQEHNKKTQRKLLSYKSNKNKIKKKTIGLPLVKHFLYSHIARLRTFFFQDGKVS